MRFFFCMTVVSLLLLFLAAPALAQERPVIAAGDTIILTVDDQANLTGRFVVAPNGTLTLDLVGVIQVDGLTSDQLEADLRKRLGAFLRNPWVRVQVEPAQRVFVFGEVPRPGSLELTAKMTLLEALGRTGYTGTSEVIVARPAKAAGPTPIDAPDAQVIRVNLRELEKELAAGQLARNLVLRDGDSIYVPKDDPNRIYVSGEVMEPGWFSIPEGTTVIQALTLAGGVTEKAALGRVRISRFVDGDVQSIKASVDDAVRAGDTLLVPEKFSLPIDLGLPSPDPKDLPGRIHLGPAVWVRPVATVKRFGVDNNVFNNSDASSDFTVVAGPRLEAAVDLQRLDVTAEADLDFVYFRRFSSERSVNSVARATIVMSPVERLRLTLAGVTANTRDRIDATFDERVRRFERSLDAAARFQPLRRLTVGVSGRDFDRVIGEGAAGQGAVARTTLTERVQSITATVQYAVTPLTQLEVSGTAATHRFALAPRKDSDATEFSIGATFKPGALVLGDVRVGYLKHLGLVDSTPDLETPFGSARIYWDASDRTRLGFTAERVSGNAFSPEFQYSLIDRAGGTLRRALTQRFDMLLEAYLEKFTFKKYAPTPAVPFAFVRPDDVTETNRRYGAELGVHVKAVRIGVGMTYIERFSLLLDSRTYSVVRAMMNVSYGVFGARAQ
jgi:polysaccharide export outer membrane protein